MLDPIAFSIFGFSIHWYGIMYVIGFLFTYWFIMRYAVNFGIKKTHLEDIFLSAMLAGIIGGRLFYIIFYNPTFYLQNIFQIFAVWNGGMAIHGGILGVFLALFYSSKKFKLSFLKLTDLFSIPALLGLAFGRLANFVNQELVGKPTTSNLGIIFPLYDDVKRWPTQIFESTKNILAFQILLWLKFSSKLKAGIITAWFLILYNFGRFIIDFLRVPTIDLGIISLGQIFCLIYGFAGIVLLIKLKHE